MTFWTSFFPPRKRHFIAAEIYTELGFQKHPQSCHSLHTTNPIRLGAYPAKKVCLLQKPALGNAPLLLSPPLHGCFSGCDKAGAGKAVSVSGVSGARASVEYIAVYATALSCSGLSGTLPAGLPCSLHPRVTRSASSQGQIHPVRSWDSACASAPSLPPILN